MKKNKLNNKMKSFLTISAFSITTAASFAVIASCNQKSSELNTNSKVQKSQSDRLLKKIKISDFKPFAKNKGIESITKNDFVLKEEKPGVKLIIKNLIKSGSTITIEFEIEKDSTVSSKFNTLTFDIAKDHSIEEESKKKENNSNKNEQKIDQNQLDQQTYEREVQPLDNILLKKHIKFNFEGVSFSELNKNNFDFSSLKNFLETSNGLSRYEIVFTKVENFVNQTKTFDLLVTINDIKNNKITPKQVKINYPIEFIRNDTLKMDQIKYLAFGDSVSAGLNSEFGYGMPGKYDESKKKISGLSYSAFLANYIQKSFPGKLNSFENFGLIGTRIDEWLYILGDEDKEKYNYEHSKTLFNFLLSMDKDQDNPFKGRVQKQFSDFKNADHFADFKTKLQNANLITINLGANDILSAITDSLFTILGNLDDPDEIQKSLYFSEETNKIVAKLIKINALVRKVNPEAAVNFVSYPLPLLRISPIIDEAAKDGGLGTNFSEKLLGQLNGAIKKAVEKINADQSEQHTGFINAYDSNDWEEHANQFAKVFYDIHPTTKGYKKMAQDIFLKLFLKERKSKELIKLIPEWDKVYFETDKNNFTKIIINNVTKNDGELLDAVLGKERKDIFDENELEKSLVEKKIPILANVVRHYIYSNKSAVENILFKIIDQIKVAGLDPEDLLKKFLLKEDNYYKIAKIIANSPSINKVLNGIQTDFDKGYQPEAKKITLDIFKKILKKNVFNEDTIYSLMQSLFKSEIFKSQENKNEIKAIFSSIFKNIIKKIDDPQNKLMRLLPPSIKDVISSVIGKEVVGVIKNSQELENLVFLLVNELVDNIEQHSNANSFEGLIKNVLSKPNVKLGIKNNLRVVILELLELDGLSALAQSKVMQLLVVKGEPSSQRNKEFIKAIFSAIKAMMKSSIYDSGFEIIYNTIKEKGFSAILDPTLLKQLTKIINPNSTEDIKKLISLVKTGSDFSGKELGILINYIFEFSDVEKGPVYKFLTSTSGSKANIDLIGATKLLNDIWHISKTLKVAYHDYKRENPDVEIKANPYYKASFRLSAAMNIIVSSALGPQNYWNIGASIIKNNLTDGTAGFEEIYKPFYDSIDGWNNSLWYYAWGFFNTNPRYKNKWKIALIKSLKEGDLIRIKDFQN